jgi:hypothetical protein
MEHEVQIVVKRPDDPLAQAKQVNDRPPFNSAWRRVHGAEEKRARNLCSFEHPALDKWTETLDVYGDIRKLWHGRRDVRPAKTFLVNIPVSIPLRSRIH